MRRGAAGAGDGLGGAETSPGLSDVCPLVLCPDSTHSTILAHSSPGVDMSALFLLLLPLLLLFLLLLLFCLEISGLTCPFSSTSKDTWLCVEIDDMWLLLLPLQLFLDVVFLVECSALSSITLE